MEEKVTKLTQKGYDEKLAHLSYLKGEKTQEILKRIDIARGFGDLSENSEYDEARQAQTDNNAEIARLEAILKNVEIIESASSTDVVAMGHDVLLKSLWNNKETLYYIVGFAEVDPFKNYISNDTPLGAAILGKKVGDKVVVHAPKGDREYEILKITLHADN